MVFLLTNSMLTFLFFLQLNFKQHHFRLTSLDSSVNFNEIKYDNIDNISSKVIFLRSLQTSNEDQCTTNLTSKSCGTDNCNVIGGNCVNSLCVCKSGYITRTTLISKNNAPQIKCCYQQKSQLTAFLLEFIFSFGFGHFYRGDNLVGCLKFFLYLGLYIVDGYLLYYKKKQVENENFSMKVDLLVYSVTIFVFLFWIIWQVYDCVQFGSNSYKDQNGEPLFSWISK